MAYLSKYGVARKIRIPMVKRGVVDHAVSADWTPAAGDVKISKDGGAAANVTNLPTAIAMGNSTIWEFSLTATEMQAAQINITIGDTATKAVEDSGFDIETYGNASGQHAVDLSDSVRAGLTALPNATAGANGGLPLAVDASGRVDVLKINGTSQTARDIGASVLLSAGTGAGQLDFTSGVVKVNAVQWLGGTIPAVNVTGVPLVDAKYLLGTIFSTPATAGVIDVNLKNIANAAVSTSTAQLGVNAVQAGATAWGSGAITAGSIAASALNGKGDWNIGKTGYALSAAGVQAIWDALTSALTTVGSIGKLLVTNIDAAVSSRLASGSYTAPLDASGTRAAVGLASANLDTQLGTIAGYIDTEITTLQTTASAIKTKTDSLTFTKAGEVDANIQSVNDTTVNGAGTSGSPWGP